MTFFNDWSPWFRISISRVPAWSIKWVCLMLHITSGHKQMVSPFFLTQKKKKHNQVPEKEDFWGFQGWRVDEEIRVIPSATNINQIYLSSELGGDKFGWTITEQRERAFCKGWMDRKKFSNVPLSSVCFLSLSLSVWLIDGICFLSYFIRDIFRIFVHYVFISLSLRDCLLRRFLWIREILDLKTFCRERSFLVERKSMMTFEWDGKSASSKSKVDNCQKCCERVSISQKSFGKMICDSNLLHQWAANIFSSPRTGLRNQNKRNMKTSHWLVKIARASEKITKFLTKKIRALLREKNTQKVTARNLIYFFHSCASQELARSDNRREANYLCFQTINSPRWWQAKLLHIAQSDANVSQLA